MALQFYKITSTGKTYQLDKETKIAKQISSIPTGGATISWGGKNLPSELQAGLSKTAPTKKAPTTPTYTPPKTTTPAPTPAQPTSTYQGSSIVDYLKSTGQASDYSSRAKLAQEKGITNYRGTAEQNTQLLGMLKQPTAPTAPTDKPTVLTPDQQKEYFASQGKLATPLSPTDWLAKKTEPAKDISELDKAKRVQEEITQITADENARTEDELATIEQEISGEVDVSKSAKLIASLYEAEVEQPEAPSLAEQFQTERQRLGIEPLETELAGIDSQIEEIQSNLIIEAEKAGERLVPMGQITKRRGKLQTEADQRIQRLQIERNSLARRLDGKLQTMGIFMDLTQEDFQNASEQYQQEFNNKLQIISLLQDVESEETAESQANAEIIINAMSERGLTADNLTREQTIQLQKSALTQGLGINFYTDLLQTAITPEKKIQTTIISKDKTQATLLYDDGTTQTISTGLRGEVGGERKDKPMSINQIEQFRRSYGWTPPFGYTQPQLLQYMQDNPNASPEDLEAGAKQEKGDTETTTTEPTQTVEELTSSIMDSITDEQLKTLKTKADTAGISSMWKSKTTDVKNYLNSIKGDLQDALTYDYTIDEIINKLTQ